MSDAKPSPSAGWYENADKKLQWWDGEKWGVLAPDASTPLNQPLNNSGAMKPVEEPKKSNFMMGCLLPLLVVAGLVIGFQIFNMSKNSSSSNSSSNSSSSSTPPAPAPPEKTAAEITDEAMQNDGWKVAESGETYTRFLTEEEKAQTSCGYSRCSDVLIASMSGCSGGFYVKADLLNGDTPVGWTNEISASVKAGETVVVRLEDFQNIATGFRLSEVNCMG